MNSFLVDVYHTVDGFKRKLTLFQTGSFLIFVWLLALYAFVRDLGFCFSKPISVGEELGEQVEIR